MLYRRAIKQVIPVSSAEVAEVAKILENTYRSINIALANEMKVILTAMGIDVWEVMPPRRPSRSGSRRFTRARGTS